MHGLANPGDRCWFNAGVQVLLHSPHLVNYATSDLFEQHLHGRRANACAAAKAFARLARAYWRGEGDRDLIDGAAADVWAALTKVHPRLARGQHDVHEMLVLLTRLLADALAKGSRVARAESSTSASPACDYDAWAAAAGAGFVPEIFMGQSRVTTATTAATTTTSWDHWWGLSLAIDEVNTLAAALAAEDVAETLASGGVRTHSVTHAPPTLVVHLKRFDASGAKIDKFVGYDVDLALGEARYVLFGVVLHSGDAGGGHYTALAEHKGRWAFADDAVVTAVDDINKIVQKDAYVLLYKKIPP
jgi:ubiquitin C-terminal hydrolase